MYRFFLTIALCVTVCSSCGKSTTSEIRQGHATKTQFEVDNSIQVVIKQILNKNNECQYAGRGHVTILDELGEAHIEHRSTQGGIFILVDLSRQSDKTRVTIYTANKMFDSAAKILEYGAKNLPGCP
ncbi:MAG: hypothetical protein FWH34_00325 [Desulfovibrionaceae bacterium]|nr:hypothetical protein [Desulfovibrionaceae bacterium]